MADVASITWAPGGEWGDAAKVAAGDYRTFEYSIQYTEPAKSFADTPLEASAKAGLLGVPLPAGAKLIERFKGNPAEYLDPSERYSITATADSIASFFTKQMPKHGWRKDGASQGRFLIYRKGKFMLGVFVDEDGGGFKLVGS